MIRIIASIAVLACGLACASVEGTRNTSRTISGETLSSPTRIAVAPVPPSAEADELADRVETGLADALSGRLPASQIVSPDEFRQKLGSRKGYAAHYAKWRSVYAQTRIIEPGPLPHYGKALDADYLLLIEDVSLDREKIRARDTGRAGWVSDANNVWRTKLRLPAVVISTATGEVVWKGVGEAEDINSPTKGLDFGVMVFESRNPEIEEFLDELVSVASNGLAQAIAAPPASAAD